MTKIVVIGCGKVGLSYIVELALLKKENLEFILIDQNKDQLQGEIWDMEQAFSLIGNSIKLKIGTYEDVEDADFVVITAGVKQSVKNRLDDLEQANLIIHSITQELKKHNFKGIYLVASNPLDIMTYLVAKEMNYPKEKVIGSGCLLDTIRLKKELTKKLGYAPTSYDIFVLGEHGNSQFINWEESSVATKKLNHILDKKSRQELEEKVKNMGNSIIASKGYTCYGVGLCLAKLTLAILNDEKEIYSVSFYQEEENIYYSMPAVIGKEGIEQKISLELTKEEQEKKQKSISILKDAIKKLENN